MTCSNGACGIGNGSNAFKFRQQQFGQISGPNSRIKRDLAEIQHGIQTGNPAEKQDGERRLAQDSMRGQGPFTGRRGGGQCPKCMGCDCGR